MNVDSEECEGMRETGNDKELCPVCLAQLTLDMHMVENSALGTECSSWSCIGGRFSLKHSKI